MPNTLQELTAWLRDQPSDVTVHLRDLERFQGRPLPASAWKHAAFWSNTSAYAPAWTQAGFRVSRRGVLPDHVRFERVVPAGSASPRPSATAMQVVPSAGPREGGLPDVILVSCANTKLSAPAQAQDLYVSDGFRKRRHYAEALGVRWFILSAEHGLLAPGALVEPYDVALADQPASFRRAWGEWVVVKLVRELGSLTGAMVEVHASEAYAAAIRQPLQRAGAALHEPLRGLAQGERLSWYLHNDPPGSPDHDGDEGIPRGQAPAALLMDASRRYRLADVQPQQVPAEPGLYSWFVDRSGADDLARGLGHPVQEGLIYAGQAGATRRHSGKASSNTLRTRLLSMHAAGRASGSTFRLTLAACLNLTTEAGIDEEALTTWMRSHLSLAWVPLPGGHVAAAEDALLDELDPLLNLMGRRRTALRLTLKVLRKRLR